MLFESGHVLIVGTIVAACVAITTIGAVVIYIMAVEAMTEWRQDGKPWFGKGWWAKLRDFTDRQWRTA